MKNRILVAMVVLSVCMVIKSEAKSLAEMIATIDGTPKNIVRIESLLRQLSDRYNQSEKDIGDRSATTQDLIAKNGITVSITDILEDMNRIVGAPSEDFCRLLVVYELMLNRGKSRSETVTMLNAALREDPDMLKKAF